MDAPLLSPLTNTTNLLTIPDFCALLQISESACFRLLKRGLPSQKVPGIGRRILRNQALAWLEAGKGKKGGSRALPARTSGAIVQRMKTKTSNFSLTFIASKQSFKAKVRKPDGSGWMDKWLPKSKFSSPTQELDAEAWLIQWMNDFHKTFTPADNKTCTVVGIKTIRQLFPRWLEFRSNSPRTKPNTLNGYKFGRNWILDTEGFSHYSIDALNIESELSKVDVLRKWIASLDCSPGSKLTAISTLSTMLDDCAAQEWISEEFVNPFQKPGMRAVIADIRALYKLSVERNKKPVRIESINKMAQSDSVPDVRKVRYGVAVHGLRDQEIQALTWADVALTDVAHVSVTKSLLKRGCLPVRVYEELLLLSADERKQAFETDPNAIVSTPKTKSSHRKVPLHPNVVDALRWWKRTGWRLYVGRKPTDTDPVFPRSNKKTRADQCAGDYSEYDTRRQVKIDLREVGEPDQHKAHDLRKTFATELRNAGVPKEIRDRLMGHADNSVGAVSYEGDEDTARLQELASHVAKLPIGAIAVGSVDTKLTLVAGGSPEKTRVA